jgi:hypothetical protein
LNYIIYFKIHLRRTLTILCILGFANLIADGISTAVGDYLSTKAEKENESAERKREE